MKRPLPANTRDRAHAIVDELFDLLEKPVADIAVDEVSSVRLPPDAKNADVFNRACRSGRVKGARKVGKVWIATRGDWEARERCKPPVPPKATARALKKAKAANNNETTAATEVLDAIGIVRSTG